MLIRVSTVIRLINNSSTVRKGSRFYLILIVRIEYPFFGGGPEEECYSS